MTALVRRPTPRRRDDEGASAVEYGLLVAAIAAIIILVVFALGSFVKGAFKDSCDSFETAGTVNRAGGASLQSCAA